MSEASLRNRELARIHIAKAQLGMDRETYEQMLYTVGGPAARRDDAISAANLDHVGRNRVIEHLKSRGAFHVKHSRARNPEWGWVDRAAGDRQPMLRKVIAILRAAQPRRQRGYADAMCKTMFGTERLELVAPDQLHKLVAALVRDQARRAARAASATHPHPNPPPDGEGNKSETANV